MASEDKDDVVHESAQEPAPPSKTDVFVDEWFSAHFPGSAVARDTQAWNVAHAAKEDLKKRLAAQT